MYGAQIWHCCSWEMIWAPRDGAMYSKPAREDGHAASVLFRYFSFSRSSGDMQGQSRDFGRYYLTQYAMTERSRYYIERCPVLCDSFYLKQGQFEANNLVECEKEFRPRCKSTSNRMWAFYCGQSCRVFLCAVERYQETL